MSLGFWGQFSMFLRTETDNLNVSITIFGILETVGKQKANRGTMGTWVFCYIAEI